MGEQHLALAIDLGLDAQSVQLNLGQIARHRRMGMHAGTPVLAVLADQQVQTDRHQAAIGGPGLAVQQHVADDRVVGIVLGVAEQDGAGGTVQLDAAVRIIQGDAVTVAEHAQRAATGAGEDMHATLAERFGLGHSGAQQQGQQCAAR